jgi:uncharacterized protein (DUF2062 family)
VLHNQQIANNSFTESPLSDRIRFNRIRKKAPHFVASDPKQNDCMHPRIKRFLPTRESINNNRWLRWLGPSLMHPRLWHFSRRGVAIGVGLGIFFGLLIPIAQIPFAAGSAVLLRANIPVAIGSTLVTNPVTFAPIYYGAYKLGLWVTRAEDSEALSPENYQQNQNATAETDANSVLTALSNMGKPLIIGLLIIATFMGLSAYLIITLIWRWRVMAKRRRRCPQ